MAKPGGASKAGRLDFSGDTATPPMATLDAKVTDLGLLEHYKVITDKVWDSIWITELEAYLIDTQEFQRLHWVLQLGAAIFVFPDASHNRFEHSLGVLEATERIMASCNDNAKNYAGNRIGAYARLVGRLAGLLHDLAQMPYAHTLDLEGEGHLFSTEWKCDALAGQLLGKNGFVAQRLARFFQTHNFPAAPKDLALLAESLREDLEWILTKAGQDNEPPAKEKAYLRYLADIVGNTICADLIDYVQRDLLSVGFRDRLGLRPVQFMVVREIDSLPRLVLALWKPTRPDKMRADTISEAIEFLRKRYTLGERVYYHHAKMAASAMIVKAVDLAGLQCLDIWPFGDHGLLNHLAAMKGSVGAPTPAREFAESLLTRDLFKLAYELKHAEEAEPGGIVKRAKDDYATGDGARKNQVWLEKTLVDALGIRNEDLVVYSPDPDMNLKVFNARVWPKRSENPLKLRDLQAAQVESTELITKHKGLWRLALFVRKEVLEKPGMKDRILRACRALLETVEPDLETLAEVFVENHKDDFIKILGSPSWEEKEQVVNQVKAVLSGRARGTFEFPRVESVAEVVQAASRKAGVQ